MNRRELRLLTKSFASPSTGRGLALVLIDLGLFCLCFRAALSSPYVLDRAVASVFEGLWIARLFVLGHDACHGSLCASQPINRLAGRVVFLPSLTPYSLWEIGHNTVHHMFTNLRGRDYVWVPLAVADWPHLSKPKQLLERVYRSLLGVGSYRLPEQWCRFPGRKDRQAQSITRAEV